MLFDKIKKYSPPLRYSILEGVFASLMFGGGSVFIIPFAVFLGAGSLEVGFLFAFPALFAAWAQLGAVKLLEFYKERRKAIIALVFFQAISWLLIAIIPFIFPKSQILWLIIIYTAGTIVSSIGSPIWQSWMRELTPKEILGEYFGRRNAITGAAVFLTMLACGILLKIVEPSMTLYAFSAIFLLSFVGRSLSAVTFTKITDPSFFIEDKKTHLMIFINQLGKNNYGYFVLFGALMTFAIALVGPFFSLYLLENLGLKKDYLTYTLIICSSAIATLISMPYWGKIIDKYGTIKVLKATALLASIYPIALIFVREPIGLTIAEFMSGIIFSGFNLCIANFIYESFDSDKILKYASYQGVLFGTATFFGIITSGYILQFPISIGFLSTSFYVVCAIAIVLRLFIFSMLINKIKDIRKTTPIKSRKIVLNVLTFEPVRETLFDNLNLLIVGTKKGIKTTINTVEKLGLKEEKEIFRTAKKAGGKAVNGIKQVGHFTKKGIKGVEKIEQKILRKRKRFF